MSTSGSKARSSAAQNRQLILVAAVVVVLAAIGILVATSANSPAAVSTDGAVVSGVITPAQYVSQFTDTGAPHLLVDVRTPAEYASGHLANSVNIPLDQLASRLGEVPADLPVVVYCRSGNRSAQAASLLNGAGYTQVLDLGGIIDWQAAGYPVVQ